MACSCAKTSMRGTLPPCLQSHFNGCLLRPGELETWRAGDLEIWKAGELEISRAGDLETLRGFFCQDSSARSLQPGILSQEFSARSPQPGFFGHKIPQPGILSQTSSARISQPGVLSKIAQPGFLGQESPARSPQSGSSQPDILSQDWVVPRRRVSNAMFVSATQLNL